MKIAAIYLNSFRSTQELVIPTDAARVLIAGRNHTGKSSVREALRWVLTGRASVTDAKGLGAEKLIPTWGTVADVVLQVDGIGGVRRQFGPGSKLFTVEGFTGDGPVQHQALLDRLGTTQAFVEACLDTDRFLKLHHIDAKALILTLLDVRVSVGVTTFTLDEIDTAYKKAFEERKAAKVKLRAFSLPALPTSPLPTGAQPPLEAAISVQLQKLRGILESAVGVSGDAAGRRKVLEDALARAKAFTPYVGTISKTDALDQIATLDAQVADLEAGMEAAVTMPVTPAAPTSEAEGLRRTITLLVEHQPKSGCVLDSGVPCETHKIKFTNRSKALQQTLDALSGDDAPATAVGPVKPTESPLKAARARLQALRTIVGHYEQSAVLERDNAGTIVRLEAELAAVPDVSAQTAEIQTLKGRIANGEALQLQARTYWTALYAHQEGLKKQAALEKDVASLEEACQLYGPNGARADALASAIGAFTAKVNTATARFGWTVAFTVDPWGVTVNDRAVETYSESEQYLIGIGIQLAIAELCGLSFAVVDRLDMLDLEHRGIATKILLDCPLEQVFILATREGNSPLPTREDMIAHRLTNPSGQTVITESVPA